MRGNRSLASYRYVGWVCGMATLVAVLHTETVRADVLILDDGTGSPGAVSRTVGYQFTVGGQDLTVTSLGMWDEGSDGIGGTQYPHRVGIWDALGTLLTSVTLPTGTAAPLVGEFRYEGLGSTLDLLSGTTYTIGASYVGAEGDNYRGHSATPVTSGVAHSFVAMDSNSTTSLVRPTNARGTGDRMYIGPNFQYTLAPTYIPEPGALCLVLTGMGALLLRRRSLRA